MHIVVLRAGDVVPAVAARRGEFADFIRAAMGAPDDTWETLDLRAEPDWDEHRGDAFVVTGSSSSVTEVRHPEHRERAAWMDAAARRLRRAVEAGAPVLGLCFGHQLLAHALGGEVALNPRGREIGTIRVRITTPDPLFEGLGDECMVQATHVDSVVRLPEGARVIATSDLEPVAAYAYGERARGVQFHPELDDDAMRGYLDARAARIRAEGLDLDPLRHSVKPTPDGATILKNFRALLARR